MLAAAAGHGEIIERLLRAGADVNRRARDRRTPLTAAAAAGRADAVRRLLAAGAARDAPGKGDESALVIAARYGFLVRRP